MMIKSDEATVRPRMNQAHAFITVMAGWWRSDANRPGPAWMYWLWTGVFSCLIGIGLTVLFLIFDKHKALWETFWETLLISLCIGYSIHVLFELVFRYLLPRPVDQWSASKRALMFITVPLLGVVLGYTLSFALQGRNFLRITVQYPREAFGLFIIGALACVVWYVVMDAQAKRHRRELELERERARTEALSRQASEAELRVLQSQIEPHFLFNTLANVVSLMDYDAPQAKHMLEAFIDYLRSSLDANRRTQATVGDELQLVERYLQLLQIRLGARLRYAIVADAQVREMPLAPLMLQPLVENAVKYGIEPKVEGGGVSITARVENHLLILTVLDDGVGLNEGSAARKGSGTALANIRERLSALYSDGASLSLSSEELATTGTLATITIPIRANTTNTKGGAA